MKAHISITAAAKLAAAVILGGAILTVTSCFYMPGVSGKARAGLVLPRYIAANTTSLALIVGGPGMEPIFGTYPVGTTSVTLTVPSGVARTFTLLANTPSVTLKGEATVDLAPDETKEIVLTPVTDSSQIIVPDNRNNRLVQISDMSGTGWAELAGAATAIYPYDVDFDSQGTIYVADYSSPGIFQIDDIFDSTFTTLTGVTASYIKSIAMDRTRGLLYYTDGYTLYRIQVSPTPGTEELVDLNSQGIYVNNVRGIAVDSDGFVYIANNYNSPAEVLKINPNPAATPSVVASYSGVLAFAFDVLVNGDHIYVSDPAAPKIVRLSKDLKFEDSFSGSASDPFLGPERFVAILNKRITVMDEPHDQYGNSTNANARLVSFGGVDGADWTTYGSYGATVQGPGYFEFYNSYMY